MKRGNFLSSLVVTVTLTSCVTTDLGTIGAIQAQTAALCRFVPTAKTIASLLSLEIGSIAAIVGEICKAVTEPATVKAGQRPEISGVPIEGYHVRTR